MAAQPPVLRPADWLKAASLGVEMAAAVFAGAWLGYVVDGWWHSSPWGLAAGVVLGAVAGFWSAYKLAIK
ncbi:MAG: AtpZ/AtpI family protein [Candidatus Margulisiibacteriota bacterium]